MYTGTHTHTLSKYTLTDQIPDTLNMYPHTRIHSQACLYKKCDNHRENNNGVRGRPHNSPNMFPILLCVCETRVETTHCPPLSSHSVFSACANSASSKHTPIHNTPIEQQRDTHAHTHTHTYTQECTSWLTSGEWGSGFCCRSHSVHSLHTNHFLFLRASQPIRRLNQPDRIFTGIEGMEKTNNYYSQGLH